MNCPDCKYIMSAFDAECPRCARYGKPPAPALVGEPAPPPPVTFVPSPYPPMPSGTPSQPMPQALSVFLGMMMMALAVVVIVCVIVAVNQNAEHGREIDNICGRMNASSGMSMSDCRAQLAAQGY